MYIEKNSQKRKREKKEGKREERNDLYRRRGRQNIFGDCKRSRNQISIF